METRFFFLHWNVGKWAIGLFYKISKFCFWFDTRNNQENGQKWNFRSWIIIDSFPMEPLEIATETKVHENGSSLTSNTSFTKLLLTAFNEICILLLNIIFVQAFFQTIYWLFASGGGSSLSVCAKIQKNYKQKFWKQIFPIRLEKQF